MSALGYDFAPGALVRARGREWVVQPRSSKDLLRLPTVRLLIADDVGIGKTIDAGLIVRELLDRGEITRAAVLCPPHLVDQWQQELCTHFHIKAIGLTASSATHLEKKSAAWRLAFRSSCLCCRQSGLH